MTDKLSKLVYIGSTDHVKSRLNAYRWPGNKRKSLLFRRLKEVGLEGFDFTILCTGSEKYIRELESAAITYFNTIHPYGLNMTSASNGGPTITRRIEYKGVIYRKPEDLINIVYMTKAMIMYRCDREMEGFKWLYY